MLEFLKIPFLNQHFMLYIDGFPDDVICNIAICGDDTTLYSKCDQVSDLWQQLEFDQGDVVDWDRKCLVDLLLKQLNLFCLTGLIALVLLMWKWMGLFLRKKSSFKMLGLSFSSKLDWSSYIISIAKSASKKIGPLIRSMKFLSPEVAPYFYRSTIQPCMEYFCHAWAPRFLEMLDKLHKRICRTVCPSLVASLEPLAHRRNVVSLIFFYSYYFGRCSSELAQLVPRPHFQGRSTCYSDRSHDISVTIPRCYKDVYVNSFFPVTFSPWNSLPREHFPLSNDLNSFKSKINRHLLSVGSFYTDFLYAAIFLHFFFM